MKKKLNLILLVFFVGLVAYCPLHSQDSGLQNSYKSAIEKEKKELKKKIKKVNQMLMDGIIEEDEAEEMKKAAALEHAKAINEHLKQIENFDIEDEEKKEKRPIINITFNKEKEEDEKNESHSDDHSTNYYDSGYSYLLFGFGWYNLHSSEHGLFNRTYLKDFQSNSFELGWYHKRSLFDGSRYMKYSLGVSYTWNRLKFQEGFIYEKMGDQTIPIETDVEYSSVKFLSHDIIVPLLIENSRLGLGLGAYAGLNVRNALKTKIESEDKETKSKLISDFNKTKTYWGLMATVQIADVNIFIRRNMNPLFKNNEEKEYATTLGFRFELW